LPRLIWSPSALRDVGRLHAFLVGKNRPAAARAIAAIRAGVRSLAEHPQIGRTVPDTPEYREWPIAFGSYGYLALYRLDGDAVVLLAIRHGRELDYDGP
jgi:plasmid stabilization system protein ParE